MLIIGGKKIFFQRNLYKTLIDIYGLNHKLVNIISKHLGINKYKSFKVFDHYGSFQYKSKLYQFFLYHEKHMESLLRRQISKNIEGEIKLNTYRGLRHKLGFPTRGQRTHSNANTIRYLKHKKKVTRKYKKKDKS